MEKVQNTQKSIRKILDNKLKDLNQLNIKFEKRFLIISETDPNLFKNICKNDG